MNYDVVVVGGGIAGLTVAAYCKSRGYSTLVLEKQDEVGGLVGSFKREGFVFDAGIRALENSGILFPMLKDLGIDIPFVKNDVSIILQDKSVLLKGEDSITDYTDMLCSMFEDESKNIHEIAQEIMRVCGYMKNIYGIDNPLFAPRLKDSSYIFGELLPWLVKYRRDIKAASALLMPINEYLQQFTGNSSLIDMITQHFFKDTPAFFALSYFNLYLDYHYPQGGTGNLVNALVQKITRSGGLILTNREVKSVQVAEKTVTDDTGSAFCYKKLVWCCDAKSLHRRAAGDFPRKTQDFAGLSLSCKGNDSVLGMYVALNAPPKYLQKACGAHSFFTPSKTGLSALRAKPPSNAMESVQWVNKFLELTTYEISCPCLRDPSLAPEGKSAVIISTRFDYEIFNLARSAGWEEELTHRCKKRMIEVIEAGLLEDFSSKILFSEMCTPLTIERKTGNSEGAITGWAFTNDTLPAVSDMNKIRKAISSNYENVYMAGQWTVSPSGFPVSILTGKFAADALHKRLKRRRA